VFFVKYEMPPVDATTAGKKFYQQSLSEHRDGSVITFNIVLSDSCEYTGGGTRFVDINRTLRLDKGHCLLHCGKIHHEGVAISSGKRVIMVGFLKSLVRIPYIDTTHRDTDAGYILKMAQEIQRSGSLSPVPVPGKQTQKPLEKWASIIYKTFARFGVYDSAKEKL